VRRAIIAVAAALALVGGCSDDTAPEAERVQAATERCELGTRGEKVFVRLTGERAGELCGAWSRADAPGSWTEPTGASDSTGSFRRVCVLYRGRTAAGLYAAD
jgi:hypothetical protein